MKNEPIKIIKKHVIKEYNMSYKGVRYKIKISDFDGHEYMEMSKCDDQKEIKEIAEIIFGFSDFLKPFLYLRLDMWEIYDKKNKKFPEEGINKLKEDCERMARSEINQLFKGEEKIKKNEILYKKWRNFVEKNKESIIIDSL